MTARHYYRFDQDEAVAEVPNVLRWAYTGTQKAEEGEAGTYEIVVDDPDMTLDFVGHRRWTVYEDESDDDNEVIIDGLTQAVRVAHTGGDITNPIGRVWTIEIADMNTLWTYRVMTGSDSQFDEQTDVERVQQIADSEEMGYFSDMSFLFSGSAVDMDERNGRGSTTGQLMDECAQQSGKNWYIYSYGVHGEYSADFGLWYGKDSLTEYTSPLSLSNDPADLDMAAVDDGTATTYPIGKDTVLRRDYARQYDGAYGEYQNGAKYVRNPAVSDLITVTHRDMTHPAPEIKTGTRMLARLNRVLADHATPDEVISTTITLPANKVSQVRPGMRISTKATHEPGYETGRMLRVLTAAYKPIGRLYEVALELQGPGTGAPESCSAILGGLTGVSDTGAWPAMPTLSGTGFLVGAAACVNTNVPKDSDMEIVTGTMVYEDQLDGGSCQGHMYGAGTIASEYTGGFGADNASFWCTAAVELPDGSSVVQTKSGNFSVGSSPKQVTLDSTPADDSLIIVTVVASNDAPYPSAFMSPAASDIETTLINSYATNWVAITIAAVCWTTGDSLTFDLGAYSHAVAFTVWEISLG